jgi:hypothetical protein
MEALQLPQNVALALKYQDRGSRFRLYRDYAPIGSKLAALSRLVIALRLRAKLRLP